MIGRKVAVLAVAGLVVAGCGSTANHSAAVPTTSGAGSTTLAGSTATGSSGSTPVPGITATTITIGSLADVSGPVPGLFTGAVDGMDAWAAYVNSTGGINGRKVVVDHKDSALNCSTYTADIKSLATSAFADVGTYSLVDSCGEATLKANPQFVDLEGAVINATIDPLPNVFSPISMPPGYSTTGYQYVKDKFGMAAIQKSAALYSAFSTTAHTEEADTAESIGFKYVYARGVGTTETNFTSDILRMKSDGVQVVDMVAVNVNDMTDFLQEAAQQNFRPKAVINETAYDSNFFKLLGTSASGTNLIMPLEYALYLGQDAASVPEITTMQTWFHKTHPSDSLNLFTLDDWTAGLLFQEAMTKAGANPTRASFLAALQGVNNFDANGLLPPGNPGGKVPPVCVAVTGVRNGKFVRLDPAGKGFECNGTFHPVPLSS